MADLDDLVMASTSMDWVLMVGSCNLQDSQLQNICKPIDVPGVNIILVNLNFQTFWLQILKQLMTCL